MVILLYVLFGISLVYIAATEKFRNYIQVYMLQGILLFGMALTQLENFSYVNLILILSETVLFKSVVVPYLLRKILQRTGIRNVHKRSLPGNYTVVIMIIALGISLLLAKVLAIPMVDSTFLVIAFFTLFTGLVLISVRKLIFGHLVGFLIIENSVFLFSIAIGKEFPLLVNAGILLDIFIAVLIMSIFLTRIGHKMGGFEAESLTKLTD
jgi:hydrogenase-4 component E